jgi:hypothetical protein
VVIGKEMFKIDREKYFRILETQGIDAALTALHHDKESMEFVTFEGEAGYQREGWEDLAEVREFSRELWDRSVELGPPRQHN